MSTDIISGYSAVRVSSFLPSSETVAEIFKQSSDFRWTCPRHLRGGRDPAEWTFPWETQNVVSLQTYLALCRSVGSVVCSCNAAAARGRALNVLYSAE